MTPALQFRVWWRQAPVPHKVVTALIFATVISVLLVSLPTTNRSRTAALSAGSQVAATSNPAAAGTTNTDGSVTAPDGTVTAPVVVGGSSVAGTAGTAGTVAGPAGAPAPGRPGATTSGGTAVKRGGTAGKSGKGTTGTSGTVAGPAGTTGTSAAKVDVSRATDRGVNACRTITGPCVKIGVLLPNIGNLGASGFALNTRTDVQSVVAAFFKYQNDHGGINGRMVEADFRSTDPISESDQNSACTQFTQDDKVFGVIDTAALIFATTQACFTQQNLTPYIHAYAEDDAFQAKAPGYELTETRTLDRIAKEWIPELTTTGFIKGGEKVGILEDNCEPSASIVKNILVPGVMKAGAASVKLYQSDCSAASAQAQPPGFASTMCSDGVDHVMLATSFVAAQSFLSAADGSPCGQQNLANHFQYMVSDYSLLMSDLFDAKFSPTQFDNALGITNAYTGQLKAGKPAPAKLAFCNKALAEGDPSLPLMAMDATNNDTLEFCDFFFLMVDIAQKVGGNLTRAGWAKVAQNYGTFNGVQTPTSVFKPGKYSGGETIQTARWHKECRCWETTTDFHAAVG